MLTRQLNSKANAEQKTAADLPFQSRAAVLANYSAESTTNQTVINLTFSVDTVNNPDSMFLFIDGKKAVRGTSDNYSFTNIDANGYSSQVTLTSPMIAGLSIEAIKVGMKKDLDVNDARWLTQYEVMNKGFQAFVQSDNMLTATSGTPSSSQFRSSVVGRASIQDLSSNLRAQMGIERISIQQVVQLQNEFGPSGEPVWAALNDDRGLIRFVGSGWANANATDGPSVLQSGGTTDYLEVTFYGTGLNLLTTRPGARNIGWKIDGGSEALISNVDGTSSILFARNYNTNTVCPIVSGQSLGIHTVTIRINNTNINLSGFEILNESSSVKVAPGTAYVDGKKIVSSALNASAYNSGFTNVSGTAGTRGGRVLVYMDSTGAIKKDIQYVDVAQANLTSADHTNEEIIRRFHFREFGAARSDDFSTTFSASSRAFTLDDGTTTLIGNSAVITGVTGEQVRASGAGGFISFTFVGTGLDILTQTNDTNTRTTTITVDGASAGTLTTVANEVSKVVKIVSGLPYGTHTVKFTVVSFDTVFTQAYIVYGPKKPSLPAGAIELADYNLMANYVANATAGSNNLSTGILRKNASREFVYLGSWNLSLNVNTPSGFNVFDTNNNDKAQYTFVGTGFELFGIFGGGSGTMNLTIDGVSYTGAATAIGSSTYSAGTWSITSNTYGTSLQVGGLSFGLHTVVLNIATNGANTFNLNCIDIVTPIHSPKSNLYGDLQNTLPVGSNAISDNRKLTPIKDTLPATKAWVQVFGITNSPTTTSTSDIPATDMSCTIKTLGGPIQISWAVLTLNNGVSNVNTFSIYVDGVQVGRPKNQYAYAAGQYWTMNDSFILPVSAGVHKVDLFWRVNAGTGELTSTNRNLSVREL